jgi:acyl-homoserine-lactone acylase
MSYLRNTAPLTMNRMRVISISIFLVLLSAIAEAQDSRQLRRWEQRSLATTIIRDKWGIPHVYGNTDADAVFGLMYAQCEDDFPRIELNYIEKLGRLAELNGSKDLWNDLYLRMIIDSAEAIADYQKSPAWLKELLQAWSDGVEYYLYRHPDVKPKLLRRFPAWYPLLWTDGSIGAIKTGSITAEDVKQFYLHPQDPISKISYPKSDIRNHAMDLSGSNGFAIAPSKSASGKAMLYINPHVTFYFRPEVQMTSAAGLQAYGAVTWGQFFIYQGFNEYGGWMHTSSKADVADEYLETVIESDGKKFYTYNGTLKPLKQRRITIRYREGDSLRARSFTAYATHHGPVMASRKGNWISVRHYNRSLNSLEQSWLRTKTKSFADYRKVMDMRGNTSNNTVYADREGNIAYWHGNYMPKRNNLYDWNKPVDGTVRSTEYQGLHPVNETVHVYNPSTGWIQNCNSTPFTVSGHASPRKENFPSYMAPDGENFRGVNAIRLLERPGKLSMDALIGKGYDTYLAAFSVLVPALISAFDTYVPAGNLLHQEIHSAIDTLRRWDFHSGTQSIATTLAIEWAQKINTVDRKGFIDVDEADQVTATKRFAERAGYDDLLLAFRGVVMDLKERFGTWEVPWGDINRYQRLTGKIRETYEDTKPSLPVPFAESTWGSLPAFASRRMTDTKKRYGYGGNSFICVVEFGEKVRAKSLLAGGNSNQPASSHFSDQAEMYTKGQFKDVLFYRADVEKNAERTYQPGKEQ